MPEPSVDKVENLVKRYGGVRAVDGVSFAVQPGEVFGLLGRNGAGKTTTIQMLTERTRPASGRATIAGLDVATERARLGASSPIRCCSGACRGGRGEPVEG